MSAAAPVRPGGGIGPDLREQMRRGIDRVAFIGGALTTLIQVVGLVEDFTPRAIAALLVTAVVTACGAIGVWSRAPWTPFAYVGILVVANVVAVVSFGLLLGLGSVYILLITIAFMFMTPVWRWGVVAALATTPIAVGALVQVGVLARPLVFALDDPGAWGRLLFAAVAALLAIATIIGYAIRHLNVARRDIETALANEREARRAREEIERQIARANRSDLIVEIAAQVGASIGAALESVASRAEALRPHVDAEARACLADVLVAATAARSTMRSLTLFAPEARGADARCDAAQAARVLPQMVRRTIPSRIALGLDIDLAGDGAAWIPLSSNDLLRILGNLVLNARDAIAETGSIGIQLRRGAGHVIIAVTDDGAGMDDATRSRLFQPFFTTKPIGRGTGLGLATAKILIEHAGGEIDVVSAPGAGARFTIRLPEIAA